MATDDKEQCDTCGDSYSPGVDGNNRLCDGCWEDAGGSLRDQEAE